MIISEIKICYTFIERIIMQPIATSLPVDFYKEGGHFIAYCPALDISTCGDTFEEAKKNFSELLDAFVTETTKMGTLEAVLLECGWEKVTTTSTLTWEPPTRQFITETVQQVNLPCPT